jgi:branched-chain amino acid transport system ATP-binding protein
MQHRRQIFPLGFRMPMSHGVVRRADEPLGSDEFVNKPTSRSPSGSTASADDWCVYALFPVLVERKRQQANTLSGGQQQVLAIGRALMGRPILLLLDEPSVGIAHRLKMEIFQSIRAIRGAGTAVLLVEQDAGATLAIADRVYVMEHGKVARQGMPQELAADDEIRKVYLGV